MKYFVFFKCVIILLAFNTCQQHQVNTAQDIKHNDSLSIKLNSQELQLLNKNILDSIDNVRLYIQRSKIYLNYRLPEDALNDANRAILIDSNYAEAWIAKADAYLMQNEPKLCKEVLEKTVKKFSSNTEGLLKLGEMYFFLKQYERSFQLINSALRIDVSLAQAYLLKGKIYLETGDTSKAISSYETAIEQDSDNLNAFYTLGLIYAAKKNPLAKEYYQSAIKINPTSTDIIYALAMLYQNNEDFEEAKNNYQTILKIDSTHQNSLYNMGFIALAIKNDYNLAIQYFNKVILINTNHAMAYYARATCYEAQKKNQLAKDDYKQCIQINPNFFDAINALNNLK